VVGDVVVVGEVVGEVVEVVSGEVVVGEDGEVVGEVVGLVGVVVVVVWVGVSECEVGEVVGVVVGLAGSLLGELGEGDGAGTGEIRRERREDDVLGEREGGVFVSVKVSIIPGGPLAARAWSWWARR